MRICAIEGCGLRIFGREWCSKHYTRWQRHGDPLVTLRNPPSTADATEKPCPRCRKVKPLEQFGRRPNGKPTGYCFDCAARYHQERMAAPEAQAAHRKMLEEQGGRCAICRSDKPGHNNKVFCVDHCHDSNKVRGLLCVNCNMGIGQFGDDPARLRDAAEYLDRYPREVEENPCLG